jgi:hypothetical protein
MSSDKRTEDPKRMSTRIPYEQLAEGTNMDFRVTHSMPQGPCTEESYVEFNFTRNTPIMKSVPFVTFNRIVDISFKKNGIYLMLDSQGFINIMDFSSRNGKTKVPALEPLKDYQLTLSESISQTEMFDCRVKDFLKLFNFNSTILPLTEYWSQEIMVFTCKDPETDI